jgi:hypothetical protein
MPPTPRCRWGLWASVSLAETTEHRTPYFGIELPALFVDILH